ncbi:MAG: hypothetical protein JXL97_20010 [Bacteroidales bacterium]|nr:hypothetical protein [Bacteroidales bacterium]
MKDTLLDLIKYFVPALIVLITAYVVMKSFMDREISKAKLEYKLNNSKLITPIRLQAYERLVLFLERISPETVFVRVYQPGMTTKQLHQALLATVRAEYEHNLAQQVYVSDDAWEAIRNAKESVLRLINTAATSGRAQASAQEFSKLVLEAYNTVSTSPTQNAIEILKNEISEQLF